MTTKTKTVDEMIGDLHRRIEGRRAQCKAFTDPIKEEIKTMKSQIDRLLLEDGRQEVDWNLFGDPAER
jgi:hypothetical protein